MAERTEISFVVQDSAGNALSAVNVTVRPRDSMSLATVYANSTGGTTKANPFNPTLGRIEGWLDPGAYDIEVADTIVPARFTTYIERFESVSGAPLGIPGSRLENGAITTAKIGDGQVTAAKLSDDIPFGVLGYAQVSANQTVVLGPDVDLTGLSVTVTVGSNRRIKVTGHGLVATLSDYFEAKGRIFDGASSVGWWGHTRFRSAETVVVQMFEGSTVITPSAGSHTYKLTLQTLGDDIYLESSSLHRAFILVEDIGPI